VALRARAAAARLRPAVRVDAEGEVARVQRVGDGAHARGEAARVGDELPVGRAPDLDHAVVEVHVRKAQRREARRGERVGGREERRGGGAHLDVVPLRGGE